MAAVENLGLLLGSAVPSFMDALKFVRQSQENAEQLRIQRAKLAADQRVAVLNQRLRDLQAVDDVRQAVFTQGDTRWNVAYTDAVTNVGEDRANALFFRDGDPVQMTEDDIDSVMDLTKRTTASGGGIGDGLTTRQKEVLEYFKDAVDFEEQGVNLLRTKMSDLLAEQGQYDSDSSQYQYLQGEIINLDRQISDRNNSLRNARLDLQTIILNPDFDFEDVSNRRNEVLELSQDGGATQIGGGDLFQRDVFGPRQQQSYPEYSPANPPRREVDQGVTPTAQDTTRSRQLLEGFRMSEDEALRVMGGLSPELY